MTLSHVAQGDPHVEAHNAERDVINGLLTDTDTLSSHVATKIDRSPRKNSRFGSVHPDVVSVTPNAGGSIQAAYRQLVPTASPTSDPIPGIVESIGATSWSTYSGVYVMPVQPAFPEPTYRFVTDSLQVDVALFVANNWGIETFVDGRPATAAPLVPSAGQGWFSIVFNSAKPRLIEIRSSLPFGGFLIGPHSQVWKPAPVHKPRMLVVGDSYVAASGVSITNYAIYQSIADELGIEDVWLDGIGGSGYINRSVIAEGQPGNYIERLPWHVAANPDVLVVHGGGLNDMGASTVQGVVDAVTEYFTQARAQLPSAKLVFVEPFTPPLFSFLFGMFPDVIAGVRAALAAIPNTYVVDTYTSGQWLTGTGNVGAPAGDGNNDVYMSSDGAHPTDLGAAYIRRRLVPQLVKIMEA